MVHIKRLLELPPLVEKKSYFLFGPRQTGKTSIIRDQLQPARTYNLLESDTYTTLSREPARIREQVQTDGELVVIDEVQKLPSLLDEVQVLIEERKCRFLLTGSSARSLKRRGVNLLGGRARSRHLHPFVAPELGGAFDLAKALTIGTLPGIYFSDEPGTDLRAYVGDYLKEEIAAEGTARNIPAFSRFLHVAGACHGCLVNYEKISIDAQVAPSTVREYFQILRDTLIGVDLPVWKMGTGRRQTSRHKFYLFDNGVAHQLQGRKEIVASTPEYGTALEAHIFHEIKSWIDYCSPDSELCFWRTHSDLEVDFVINGTYAIEVKATGHVGIQDLKGLRAIMSEGSFKTRMLVVLEGDRRQVDGIDIVPLREFLDALWGGYFLA